MEEGDDWLDTCSYHACNQIVVVCYTLLIYWTIAKWEKSWPGQIQLPIPDSIKVFPKHTRRMKARSMEHPNLPTAQSPACTGNRSLPLHHQSNYPQPRWLVDVQSNPRLTALFLHPLLRLQLDTRSMQDPKRSHLVAWRSREMCRRSGSRIMSVVFNLRWLALT